MCRSVCLILIVALLLCGCSRKDAGSGPQGQEMPQGPPGRMETEVAQTPEDAQVQETATEADETGHPIVAVTRRFIGAVAAGRYDRALTLCVVGSKFTKQGLAGMNLAFQFDQASIGQAWLGTRQSIVITTSIPTKQGNVTGFWGFILVATEGGGWAIREGDFLPNEQAANTYFDRFLDAEPKAASLEM
jgi:hypothetical protein